MTSAATPSPRRYKVAALQMVSGPDITANCAQAEALIAEAAAAGAVLAVLPEYFPLIAADEQAKLAVRETPGAGPIQAFLSAQAAHHGIWLVGGTLPMVASTPERVRNACLVFDDAGKLLGRYDKIHLFNFRRGDEAYDEQRTIEPGDSPVALDTPFGRLGLSVCYDLRFPELYRCLGAPDLIVVPAAFTVPTGEAHWEVLLRARAIENQCYLIAAAQGGRHPSGRLTYGHSMVIDPWGAILASRDQGPGVVVAEVDLTQAQAMRESLPALRHRRL